MFVFQLHLFCCLQILSIWTSPKICFWIKMAKSFGQCQHAYTADIDMCEQFSQIHEALFLTEHNQHFLLFPNCFSTLSDSNPTEWVTFYMLPANALNMDQSTFCSCGKELCKRHRATDINMTDEIITVLCFFKGFSSCKWMPIFNFGAFKIHTGLVTLSVVGLWSSVHKHGWSCHTCQWSSCPRGETWCGISV